MDFSTTQIDALNESAWSKRERQVELTLTEGQQAYALAEKADYLRGMADALRNQGEALRQLDRSREGLPLAQRALKLYEQLKDDRNRLIVLITLSAIYDRLGNTPLALQHGLDGRKLARRVNDAALDGKLCNVLGFIYDEMGDHTQAIIQYQAALERLKGGADPGLMGKVLNNLAWTYVQQKRYDDALPLAKRGYDLLVEQQAVLDQPAVLHTIGSIYRAKGNTRRALDHYTQVLEHPEIAKDTETAIAALMDISRVHRAGEDTAQALDFLAKALALAEQEAVLIYLPEIHEEYAGLYEAMGQHQAALTHHRLFHKYHTQVFNEQSDQRMQDLEVAHGVETARLESLALFQKNQALKQEIEQNERLIGDLESYADIVAHDLKNPIALLQLHAYLLQTDLGDQLETLHQESLQAIVDTGEKMEQIVDGLLALARSRLEQVMAQPLDMNQVVAAARKRLTEALERAGAEVIVQPGLPPAAGHAPWVEAVWVNYISNALKYGGKPPLVRLSGEARPDGLVIYRVEDNGEGISPERRKLLFQKLERLGRKTVEGHGLGLSIVKSIVEKLGGQVGIEDRADGASGACFTFTLPALVASTEANAEGS
jgi:signal transduction histidine kinase